MNTTRLYAEQRRHSNMARNTDELSFDKFAGNAGWMYNNASMSSRAKFALDQQDVRESHSDAENFASLGIDRALSHSAAVCEMIKADIKEEKAAARTKPVTKKPATKPAKKPAVVALSPRRQMLAERDARKAERDAKAARGLPLSTQYYVVDETRAKSTIVRGPFRSKSAAEAVKRPDSARGTQYQVVLTGMQCRNEGLKYHAKFVDEREAAKAQPKRPAKATSKSVRAATTKRQANKPARYNVSKHLSDSLTTIANMPRTIH